MKMAGEKKVEVLTPEAKKALERAEKIIEKMA
jgi:hypothetical protein